MILALVALVYSQSFHLAPQEIESWNKVMQVGMSVSDNECSSEIQYAFNQATQTYKQNLLSPNFLDSMKYIHQVSGDIPEAESFRSQFQNLTTYFSGLYTTRLQEAKDAAYAASVAQAQAKAKEAAAQSAALAAAQKTYDVAAAAPTEVMGNNPSASNGPHAYGVISASQSDSTLVGLLLAIASIL